MSRIEQIAKAYLGAGHNAKRQLYRCLQHKRRDRQRIDANMKSFDYHCRQATRKLLELNRIDLTDVKDTEE